MESQNVQNNNFKVEGFLKIFDPKTNEVFFDGKNSIHYENMSEAIAQSLANAGHSFIAEMHFGNGGTTVDPSGVINYLPPNVKTQNSDLYNPTYYKNVDINNLEYNTNPSQNKMEIRHVPGKIYSDILVSCLLDYGEPVGQGVTDNSQSLDGDFVFDELGLKGHSTSGPGLGSLLTHVVFHPVQKSLNRQIQIDYTVRMQSITNLTNTGV